MIRGKLGSFAEDFMRLYFSMGSPRDTLSVMEEDWDTLLILDACRYDTFTEVCNLPGETQKRRSQATATDDFLRANFTDGPYYNTVYVTANPRVRTTEAIENQFHDVIHVWKTHWHDELETIHPEDVANEACKARQRYPNKRIIVHFMQPHGPFIGPTGRTQLDSHSGITNHKRIAENEEPSEDSTWIWQQLRQGLIDESVVKRAYKENLNVVLPYVKSLIETWTERVIVTSDHGNMMGERAWPFPVPIYGHPNGIRTDELVEVPWHVYSGEQRCNITWEEPQSTEVNTESDKIEGRLQALGYR